MTQIDPKWMKQVIEQQKIWQQAQDLKAQRQAVSTGLSRYAIEQLKALQAAGATRTAPAEPKKFAEAQAIATPEPDTHDEWRRLNEEDEQ